MANLNDGKWKDIVKGEGTLSGPSGKWPVYTEGEPACSNACPAGVDVKAYVNLIADRRYEEAVAVIRRANPFPAVCGRVCTHPCESSCGRKDIDDPLAIRSLKRFASDYELSRKTRPERVEIKHDEKVAVIGSGPAGLTAALELAYEGFEVKIFDSASVAGGIMAWGIPDFRLPKDIIGGEVADIAATGVEIALNTEVGNPKVLLNEGFSAVILATGCKVPVRLNVEGAGNERIVDCLDFLRGSITGSKVPVTGKVLVIGGGSAALDSARTAVRTGADVTVVYRRTRGEMPVPVHEIDEAEEEGVRFEFLAIPDSLKVEGPDLKGLKCQRTRLGEPDESGRRRPEPVPGEFFDLDADWIITAIGSKPDQSYFQSNGLETTKWGSVKVDDDGQSSVRGIFAAGDAVTGPSSIVDAIGSAHIAAKGVVAFLTGESIVEAHRPAMLVIDTPFEEKPRVVAPALPAESRRSTFDEVDVGYDEVAALAEASRCRRCGSCNVCDVCLAPCRHVQLIAEDAEGNATLVKAPRELATQILDDPAKGEGWSLEVHGERLEVNLWTITAKADAEKCIACGLCDDVCVYKAVRVKFVKGQAPNAVVDPEACRACGACAAVCPTGAISVGYFDDSELTKSLTHHTIFSCIWRNAEGLDRAEGVAKMTCTRRLSPYLALRALASGVEKVTVAGCEDDGCHYLPGPRMGVDAVAGIMATLEEAGIETAKLRFVETAAESDMMMDPDEKAPKTPCPEPASVGQLGKSIALALDIAGKQSSMKAARIKSAVLESYGLESLAGMMESAGTLEELQEPDFESADVCVAVHSCSRPLVEGEVERLASIPGIKVIVMGDTCGQTAWKQANSKSRRAALDLLERAAADGASLLLTDSPDCLSHLQAVTRSWNESSIKVDDVYSFILSKLKGGGT